MNSVSCSQISSSCNCPIFESAIMWSFYQKSLFSCITFQLSYSKWRERISRLNNLLLNKLTFSRGLLLLLSFAEQKVINSISSKLNVVASGIFTQDCMIVNSAKTWTDSKLIPSPALNSLTLSRLHHELYLVNYTTLKKDYSLFYQSYYKKLIYWV